MPKLKKDKEITPINVDDCIKCGMSGRFLVASPFDKKSTPYYLCEEHNRTITNQERRELGYEILRM